MIQHTNEIQTINRCQNAHKTLLPTKEQHNVWRLITSALLESPFINAAVTKDLSFGEFLFETITSSTFQ